MAIYKLSDRIKCQIQLGARHGSPAVLFTMKKIYSNHTKKLYVNASAMATLFSKGRDALFISENIERRFKEGAFENGAPPVSVIPLTHGPLRDQKKLEISIFAQAVYISITTIKNHAPAPELSFSFLREEFAELMKYKVPILTELESLHDAAKKRKREEQEEQVDMPSVKEYSWVAVHADTDVYKTRENFSLSHDEHLDSMDQLGGDYRIHELQRQVPVPPNHAVLLAAYTALTMKKRKHQAKKSTEQVSAESVAATPPSNDAAKPDPRRLRISSNDENHTPDLSGLLGKLPQQPQDNSEQLSQQGVITCDCEAGACPEPFITSTRDQKTSTDKVLADCDQSLLSRSEDVAECSQTPLIKGGEKVEDKRQAREATSSPEDPFKVVNEPDRDHVWSLNDDQCTYKADSLDPLSKSFEGLQKQAIADFDELHVDTSPLTILNLSYDMLDEMEMVNEGSLCVKTPSCGEKLMIMQLATGCDVSGQNVDPLVIPSPQLVSLAVYCCEKEAM